jgi:hypothetical protein
MVKNNNCKGCGKELEWYRGRPKEWCAKCLYVDTLRRGREYYTKNRKLRLKKSNEYRIKNKEKVARLQRQRCKNYTPEQIEERKTYMKKYHAKRKQLNKHSTSKR